MSTEIPWPIDTGRNDIDLLAGEWMRDPASTKRTIDGPVRLVFWRYTDGGIDVWIKSE